MRFKNFGNSECPVPVIGQGTWHLPEGGEARGEAKKALRAGIDKGMVHIDTAEMYGNGLSEELVGEVIKEVPRDLLFLVSKVLPSNASYRGTIKACEMSLRRMKIDHLDCYLLHWRGRYPLSETMGAMETLVQQGKIRFLGVSNFDVEDLQEAEESLSKEKITCNQVLYHLHERGIERRVVPYCKDKNIAVVAYTPFGQRPLPSATSREGRLLNSIAAKYGATPRQVILAFLVREEIMFAVPKAAKVAHVLENAGAGELVLDREDVLALSEQFPAPNRDTPLATL